MRKLLLVFSAILVSSCFFSCHRAEPFPQSWSKFTYEEYDGLLYAALQGEKVKIVLCGNFAGIEASVKIDHKCSEEQFELFKEKLVEMGCLYLGEFEKPEIKDYPDLSMYLTFVFSSDELHELWAQFGLE